MRKTLLAIALALLPLAASAFPYPESFRIVWGVDMETLLDPNLSGQVASPSLNFDFGANAVYPLRLLQGLAFEPTALVYFYNSEYSPESQAVPTAEEDASAFTLGLILDAPLAYNLSLGRSFGLGFGLGLALDARVGLTLSSGYKAADTPKINLYYWDKGRFFTPSTFLRGEYKLTDRSSFALSGRVYWPIYNLWSGDSYGFFDQAMYLFNLAIKFKLDPPKPKVAGSSAGSSAAPADSGPAAGGSAASPPTAPASSPEAP